MNVVEPAVLHVVVEHTVLAGAPQLCELSSLLVDGDMSCVCLVSPSLIRYDERHGGLVYITRPQEGQTG